MTNRTALNMLMVFAPLAWVALLVFTHFVPPQAVQAYVTFFVLLSVALTSTLSPLAYFISLRNLFVAIVSLGIIIVIEVLSLGRK